MHLPAWLHHSAKPTRENIAPGYIFLRNFKKLHEDRVMATLQMAKLGDALIVKQEAFTEEGANLPAKLAVYARDTNAGDLFFQFYARVKAEWKAKATHAIS